MNRKEKENQIKKEAKASIIALVAVIVFWAVAGLGVSKLDITVAHTPLWAITGCIGTWIFAILLVVFLCKKVFKNFSLDDEDEEVKKDE